VGWVWVLTAVDVQQVGGGVAVLGGVTIAVLSTLRYIKRTEDDVVDNLRVEIKRLEAQVADARAEVASVQAESKIEIAAVRRQNARLHHQVETLVRLMRESGVAIPEDFWA
jgi:ribosomal protein L29